MENNYHEQMTVPILKNLAIEREGSHVTLGLENLS